MKPHLSKSVNVLLDVSNVDDLERRLFASLTGNWAGGTLDVYDNHLEFELNVANQKHQSDNHEFAIEYKDITDIRLGKMMYFFSTVDIETPDGLVRLRGSGSMATMQLIKRLGNISRY